MLSHDRTSDALMVCNGMTVAVEGEIRKKTLTFCKKESVYIIYVPADNLKCICLTREKIIEYIEF